MLNAIPHQVVISESVLIVKYLFFAISYIFFTHGLLEQPKFGLAKNISRSVLSQSSLRRQSGMNIFRGRVAFIPRASEGS